MSTKASTAALDPISQRLFLRQRRASRHPASGQKLQEECTQSGEYNEMRPGRRSTKTESPVHCDLRDCGQHGSGHLCSRDIIDLVFTCLQTKTVPPQSRGRFSSSSVLVLLLASIPFLRAPIHLKMSPGCWGSRSTGRP